MKNLVFLLALTAPFHAAAQAADPLLSGEKKPCDGGAPEKKEAAAAPTPAPTPAPDLFKTEAEKKPEPKKSLGALPGPMENCK